MFTDLKIKINKRLINLKHNNPWRFAGLVLIILTGSITVSFSIVNNDGELSVFVSPSGNDFNNGSLSSPFLTISKAQYYVRGVIKGKKYSKVNVNLLGGTYFLDKPLVFNVDDSGSENCTIEYKAYRNAVPILAGGKLLPKLWVKVDNNNNYWKIKLPLPLIFNKNNINQLFANGHRLNRSRSPIFYTQGPIRRCEDDVKRVGAYNFKALTDLEQKDLLPFCSFAYNGNDLDNFDVNDQANAEMMVYGSWECSWNSINKIDKVYSAVYLKTPSHFPVGFFSNRTRYYIENTKKYLKKAGDWCYDKKNNEVWYMALPGENVNTKQFIVPETQQLLVLKGEYDSKKPIKNIKFTNIRFQYSIAPRGINIDSRLFAGTASADVPWIDSSSGFSGWQGSVESGQSVLLQNAQNIVFDRCEFSKLGSYALRIDMYSNNNKVLNCSFFDIGAGGIVIGYNRSDAAEARIPPLASPQGNVVEKSTIHDIGLIYPSGLGIAIMNADNSMINGNEVYNTEYTGISCGWTWGFVRKSYTFGNTIQNNTIHHVMRSLADGGGIYTLGVQPNTTVKGNTIHDVYRSKDAIGSLNNGFFFDEGSSKISIEGNKIYNIQNQKIRFNQTDTTKMIWKASH